MGIDAKDRIACVNTVQFWSRLPLGNGVEGDEGDDSLVAASELLCVVPLGVAAVECSSVGHPIVVWS
jgi:hypothetical protein